MRLPDFLAQLLDDADQALQSGNHLLEGAGQLLLTGDDLGVD
jgi:hypothetical protein